MKKENQEVETMEAEEEITSTDIASSNNGHGHGTAIASAQPAETYDLTLDGGMPDLSVLDSMQKGTSATAVYRTQEDWAVKKDIEQKCVFLGFKQIPDKNGEAVMTAVFADKSGVFLSGQKTLVDAMRTFKTYEGAFITYRGKKQNKSNDGSTNIFEVFRAQK